MQEESQTEKLPSEQLPSRFDPKAASRWYKIWDESGYFKAERVPGKKPFVIMIPPPNVTGSLHMGHAVNNVIQDVLIRKKRMEGIPVLWLPGTDHAGIATQNVVEKELHKEGKNRHQVGREKFLERVWEWKEQYGGTIINQLKELGCSCDWSRERFTMDEGYYTAVRHTFVELYNQGLIYRANRLINWCPRCLTALSDLEAEHRDLEGKLWYLRYPVIGDSGKQYVVVATTRPETMLGDTAVAVNPEDPRYKDLIGKKVLLPLVEREIPIIADEGVDPKFGTGAVKVTPAHDPNDFEMGVRHNLEQINIFTPEAQINENAPQFTGQDRYEAREAIIAELDEAGLLEKIEDHQHSVGHCYRCHTVVEPYLSLQWFVNMKPLAEPASKAVKDGDVGFWPKRWEKLYFHWVDNIKDWCISRQIWWGHRIPAWYCQGMQSKECKDQEGIIVSMEEPKQCPYCGSSNLKQDEDVLDTWFSSGLWPFATLGWPEKTEDLDYFYPTSVLVTARDILYFWVARMIMTGLHFMNEIPYHTVVINPTILNWEGKRMSKSLGTGLDPLDYSETYGVDALRFGLMYQMTEQQDIRFTEDKLEMSRNFATKIWNAARFVLTRWSVVSGRGSGIATLATPPRNDGAATQTSVLSPQSLTLPSRWILSRLAQATKDVTEGIESYRMGDACQALYGFIWNEYCDWYLEFSKLDDSESTNTVLITVLEQVMRLLHPFMPFVTEEIWQKLPVSARREADKSIMISSWPISDKQLIDPDAEKAIELIKEIIVDTRRLRAESMLPPKSKVKAAIKAEDQTVQQLINQSMDYIKALASLSELECSAQPAKPEHVVSAAHSQYELMVEVPREIVAESKKRLEKELQNIEKQLSGITAKLSKPEFVERAPAEVVEKERQKQADLESEQKRLQEQIASLH